MSLQPTYNFQTGLGFAPYLLHTVKDWATYNAPETKIGNYGFTEMLLANDPQSLNRTMPGPVDFVQLDFLQRWDPTYTQVGSFSCNYGAQQNLNEQSVPLNILLQTSLFIDDNTVQKYVNELNVVEQTGTPPGPASGAIVRMIMAATESMLGQLDTQLLTQLDIGYNASQSTSSVVTTNIPLNITTLPLNSAWNTVFTDFTVNQNYGTPQVITGSGYGLQFKMFNPFIGTQFNGVTPMLQSDAMKTYYDQIATTMYGANDIVVIAPNTTKLVRFMQYTGPAYSGYKGTSYFGTMTLPIQTTQNGVLPFDVDFQLKYDDCGNTALVDQYYNTSSAVGPGYQMMLRCTAGLWQLPTNSYRATDFLGAGNSNGVVRYALTNS